MSDFFRTAIYFKNVPLPERALRVALAAGVAVVPIPFAMPSWIGAVLVANGAFIALTGFVGFCPACYFAGRKLVPRREDAA